MKGLLLCLLVSLAIGALPLALDVVPPPAVHDEFSYLLQADTFAHGRLANPPLPAEFAAHFETMHVLVRPTYASKFPPGQGVALWLGRAATGHAIVGAFGAVALACAAIAWALRGAVQPRWALAGGLIAATHPLLFSWGQSYWGGGVALLGGAIAFGAAARLAGTTQRPVLHGAAFAAGLAILANSRPFEGLLLAGALVAWVACSLPLGGRARVGVRSVFDGLRGRTQPHPGPPPEGEGKRAFLSFTGFLAVALPAACAMGLYNWRVTGHGDRLPYSEYAAQYMSTPLFWWPPAPPREFGTVRASLKKNETMRTFHGEQERAEFDAQVTSPRAFLSAQLGKTRELAAAWLWPGTIVVALVPGAFLAVRRRPAARWALALVAGVPLAEFALTPWFRPHYSAVLGGAFLALVTLSLVELSQWNRRVGAAALAVVLAGNFAAVGWAVRGMIVEPNFAGVPRQNVVDELTRLPGKQLVFVRYVPGRSNIVEWVYNEADLDAAKIVFARSLDDASDAALAAHFADRRAWIATVDVAADLRPRP